jgi:hypothetical protein
MQTAERKTEVLKMLESLGEAVSSGDLAGVSRCYAFPALFLVGESTTVLESAGQLEELFGKGREYYISQGILTTRAELENIEELTDRIAAVNVRWPGFDKDGNEVHTETSHYIIQTAGNEPRIRVALTRTK